MVEVWPMQDGPACRSNTLVERDSSQFLLGVAASEANLPSMAVSSSSALTIVLFRSAASSSGSTVIGDGTGALTISGFTGATG
jgi:hypothetical protein